MNREPFYATNIADDEKARAKSRRNILRITLALTVGPTFFFLLFGKIPAFMGFESVTLATLASCPTAVATLGQPMRRSWMGFSYGGSSSGGGRGRANWTFPVQGPRGRGSVELNAREQGGQWILSSLVLTAGGRTLDAIRCAPAVTAAAIRASHAEASVTSVIGTASGVAVGDTCSVDLRPGDTTYTCRAEVRCGSTTLYGGGTVGWIRSCGPDASGALEARDPIATPLDRDPTLDLRFGTGQVVISDQTPRGAWVVTMSFAPQPFLARGLPVNIRVR